MPQNIRNQQWRFEQTGAPVLWLRQADILRESAEVLLAHGRQLWESVGRDAKPGEDIPDLSVDQSVVMYLSLGQVSGRYPIPKDKNKLTKSPMFFEQFESAGDFNRMYDRVRQMLVNEIGNRSGP